MNNSVNKNQVNWNSLSNSAKKSMVSLNKVENEMKGARMPSMEKIKDLLTELNVPFSKFEDSTTRNYFQTTSGIQYGHSKGRDGKKLKVVLKGNYEMDFNMDSSDAYYYRMNKVRNAEFLMDLLRFVVEGCELTNRWAS